MTVSIKSSCLSFFFSSKLTAKFNKTDWPNLNLLSVNLNPVLYVFESQNAPNIGANALTINVVSIIEPRYE